MLTCKTNYYVIKKINTAQTHFRDGSIAIYLRGSISLSAVAPGRQGAALSQTLGRITGHRLLLLLVRGVVVVVAAVSLVVHHLALAVCHVAEGRVLHGGGIGKSSTVKRRVGLWRREFTEPCNNVAGKYWGEFKSERGGNTFFVKNTAM